MQQRLRLDFPFNPYHDPWVNSLFQDTPAVAKGLFEGITAGASDDIKALRIAALELEDAYQPAIYDRYFRMFGWNEFTPREIAMLPTAFSVGGDGATYDIGFGALSRLLTTSTPIKVLVLNTGAYSNTGGQASTASLTGQDSDLTRSTGWAHAGKQEDRKELGLIAAFHPNVFVAQTSTALQGHFLGNVMEYLNYSASPAVLDVYTPCQAEHGIADAAASRRARLAVESRMNPVFVHDPRRGGNLHAVFLATTATPTSTATGPRPRSPTSRTAPPGCSRFRSRPRTSRSPRRASRSSSASCPPGRSRTRCRSTSTSTSRPRPGSARCRSSGRPTTSNASRSSKWRAPSSTSWTNGAATGARCSTWRAGTSSGSMPRHRVSLEALQQRYQESVTRQESSLDTIARAMSELAASSSAPTAGLGAALAPFGGAPAGQANAAAAACSHSGHAGCERCVGAGTARSARGDVATCVNCKTCYQQVPEIFEKTTIVVDGVAKEVGHVIPGVLSRIKVTPELVSRVARLAANCDSEIIR